MSSIEPTRRLSGVTECVRSSPELALWRPWAGSRQSRNPGGLTRRLERDGGERRPRDSDVGQDHRA